MVSILRCICCDPLDGPNEDYEGIRQFNLFHTPVSIHNTRNAVPEQE